MKQSYSGIMFSNFPAYDIKLKLPASLYTQLEVEMRRAGFSDITDYLLMLICVKCDADYSLVKRDLKNV